jgi:hypothetical protein
LRAPDGDPIVFPVSSRLAKLLVSSSLFLTAPALVACGSSSSKPVNSVANADQQLSGAWRLQSFTPAVALDLPLQAVLMAEVGALVVTFGQGQFVAVGPGLNFTGRYQVVSAQDDTLQVVLFDTQGVGYHFAGQFAGTGLSFNSVDKPWAGVGTLQRAQ